MHPFLQQLLAGQAVEWKPLGEVTQYEQPTKYLVQSKEYHDGFKTPVLTAGKTFILGYTDETDGIYLASKNPVIIFDDFTTANKWVDFDFKVKSSAMKMITSADENKFLLKYIYYWLNTLPEYDNTDHKRQWISNFSNKKIPIPPLPVQTKIAQILDVFTAITAELTAELNIRNQQYQYYRDKLLSENELAKVGFEWKTLGEVVNLKRGKRLVRSELEEIGEYAVYQNSLQPLGYYHQANCPSNSTFIITAGAAGEIGYSYTDFWAADDCYYLECPKDKLNDRFVYHALVNQKQKIIGQVRKASVPRLGRNSIENILIPIPPLPEQARIVAILDKFDTLTQSIKDGLPREIELRQKQYEYYRERLLGFEL